MPNKTNIRNNRPISYDERQKLKLDHGLSGFLPEYDHLPDWQICEVNPRVLRTVHGDFRGEPVPKEKILHEYVDTVRDRIDNNDYPFAADIRVAWPNKPPIYVLRTKRNGELYVYDGQKRTINACYNSDKWIVALVVDVDEQRDVS